jgi:DnaJ-class molecular chaperone
MVLRKKSRKSQRKSNKTARKRHVHRGGATCPGCNGVGALIQTVDCSGCGGRGRFLEASTDSSGRPVKVWQNCPVCGGNGKVTVERPCYTCGGSGQVPDPPKGQRRY